VIDWYTIAMPSRANNPKTAREIIIMQRVHQNDLIGHIESTDIENWTVLKIPMEFNGHLWNTPLYWWQDKRKELGEILDPKRFGDREIGSIKNRMPDFHYSAQYQQEPVPAEGLVIKEKWFRYWELDKDYEMIWQSWDLAMDDGVDNDFTVGTVWGKIGCDRYLLDMFRGQWDINEQAKKIVFANQRYPGTRVNLIENKANGHAVAKLLKDPVQIQKIHHYAVPGITRVDPKKMGGDKKARLTLCATEFSAGSVWFPSESRMPWISEVRKELCGFPKYRTDDIVDSCSQALNWISQFGGGLAEFDYPRSLKDLYEQKVRQQELQTATVFDGAITQRGLGSIFM
jgi:predicted phage terminase large subunit-like protein